jgi:(p)ppGpp synthase/HD superfamily hydrolase
MALLSSAFLRAVLDAEHYHHDQVRKSTDIPYVSHLFGVCSIVLEAGGTETEAIASLLHDAPEDCGGEPILRAIEANFGLDVATIVEECSDSMVETGGAKPDWLTRKQRYLEHLKTAGRSTMLVSAADKLHNLRSIYSDHRQIGEAVWSRFNAPESKRDNTLWYYASLRDVYASDDSPPDPRRMPLVAALTELLDQLR